MMSLRIIRIQLDRALEFAFSAGPVTIVIVFDVSQRYVRFGEACIEFDGFQRGGPGLWQRFVWRYGAASVRRAQKIISIGQATVSESERRIFFYRLLKVFERLLQTFLGAFVVIKSSFQIKLISLVAFGIVFGKPTLLARDFKFQGVDDLTGNLSLRSQ